MASISCTYKSLVSLLLVLLIYFQSSQSCYGFQTFGFDIHHRFSNPVKDFIGADDLPEQGSLEYYAAMAHRDRIFRGRGLAGNDNDDQLLTFSDGNETFRLASLGFLHYANVSLGTPSVSFLVALDTGSDLFWVPCDCSSCVRALMTRSGTEIDLNIYSPNSSSTSKKVPCNSNLCELQRACSATSGQCPFEVLYLSNNTSSSGILVEDVLHLTTDDYQPKEIDARITFGCGQVQTGSFLDGAAPNGLFGLGMDKTSVPSILSSAGLVADSFSMCFGTDGIGRISFGDKGSSDQEETPFNVRQLHPTYNISVTQIKVEANLTNIDFSAIFDSGTSFTYLNDPAYTVISESFNSQALDKRRSSDPRIPFEYCYDMSSNGSEIMLPNVTLTMKGGSQFPVFDPIVVISEGGGYRYCLGVVKSPNVNIIGQNFMTGHRIVFDREKLVLGWKKSDCDEIEDSSTLPRKTPNSTEVPPATAVEPGNNLTPRTAGDGPNSRAPQFSVGKPPHLYLIGSSILMLFLPILLIV
ncbi:Peptidase A1 [Macleaya cordata]|uniref:Peptidase A1 n=1 Tax=Macleaya cordata TaxID=56857 RepID=A0A200Q5X6_MACCD|nr:Peptidase A1 [Macleaya cordata]